MLPARRSYKRGGWTEAENQCLYDELSAAAAQGNPLRSVFERVALKTGRKPNSIRNYYYAQWNAGNLNEMQAVRARASYVPFDEKDSEQLLEKMLAGAAQGRSVRSIAMEMGMGDRTRMLRYQNKYRSMIRSQRSLVEQVLRKLEEKGIRCQSPYRDNSLVSVASLPQLTRELTDLLRAEISRSFEPLNRTTEEIRIRAQAAEDRALYYRQQALELAILVRNEWENVGSSSEALFMAEQIIASYGTQAN